jgi:hypothetical protein
LNKLLILSLLALGYQSASAQLVTESFGIGANAFTMDFVTIGNPNNASDGSGTPISAGSVAYIYNLGKYEVSRGQIDKANAATKSKTLKTLYSSLEEAVSQGYVVNGTASKLWLSLQSKLQYKRC